MTNRIVDLADEPARLSVRLDQLVIQRAEETAATVPLEELSVIVVSHPAVTFTHAVVARIASHGGTFVVCDDKHMPVGMILPLQSHHLQAERFARQAGASLPTRKRIWQQLVKAKVSAQGRVLQELRGDDRGLIALSKQVRSGDPENMEAWASRRYWPELFRDSGFRRNRHADDSNRHLNYGYAILRAIVARAICAAGLHPSLGLHHHNRYDTFPLASDLMEPLRPLVDRAVVLYGARVDPYAPLDKEAKAALIEALTGRVAIESEERTLFDAAARTASSLVQVYAGQRKQLVLPEIL